MRSAVQMSDKTGQREWFSERVKRAKGGETHEIVFDAALRAAIEPEINKSREARYKVFSRAPPALTHALNAAGFKRLAAEKQFAFDTVAHPLQPALARLLGCGVPLDRLHDLFSGDCGRKGARSEKLALMAPLADSARRGEFCAIFRAFVLEALLCSLSRARAVLCLSLSFSSLSLPPSLCPFLHSFLPVSLPPSPDTIFTCGAPGNCPSRSRGDRRRHAGVPELSVRAGQSARRVQHWAAHRCAVWPRPG